MRNMPTLKHAVVVFREFVHLTAATAPAPGEHTREVVEGLLGCSTEQVAGLAREGVIAAR